jgi:NAD(P)-dependent dehydrogenase (short-subunit alcohol dehydrogenase family)
MRSALVTGASTGIGRATALRLDAGGWKVFAGVRREEDAASLREAGSERLAATILDVTDAEAIASVADRIAGAVGSAGLDGLVNNAGVSLPSPLETMPLDDFRRQIDVNLTGQVAVTQAVLPMIRGARGRIVFLSSIGGRIAFPGTGAYHAAKFGIEAVGDVFRRELRRWGISVSIVEPGSIATDIWDRGGAAATEIADRSPETEKLYGTAIEKYRKTLESVAGRGIPAERVARVIEHALTARRPRPRYLVGADAKFQARAKYLIPTRAFDRIVRRVTGF